MRTQMRLLTRSLLLGWSWLVIWLLQDMNQCSVADAFYFASTPSPSSSSPYHSSPTQQRPNNQPVNNLLGTSQPPLLSTNLYLEPQQSANQYSSPTSSSTTALNMGVKNIPMISKDPEMKLGVLFLNLGGPESMKDVEGFLFNLFADPDIIRLPPVLSVLQKPLAYFIAKRRAPKSSEAYQSIGGGSPIVRYTREQSQLVEDALKLKGFHNAKCYFAMRYWHPFTEEVLDEIKKDGINTMVIVPLYPQFSISTSGSSLRLLQEIFYKEPEVWGSHKVSHTVVPAWYHRKGYVKAMAKLIVEQIGQYSPDEATEGIHVLYSAHGVPQSYIEAGDPYLKQIEECIKLISREVQKQLASDRLRPAEMTRQLGLQLAGFRKADAKAVNGSVESPSIKFHLSFQSRVGPVKWLQPYTEVKLVELGKEVGVRNLVVVPVSFVSEHIETLEEIDMEYKELAHENGIVNWKRVPALNTDPIFIEDLTDLVIEALESPTLTVAEAASKSYSDMLDQQVLSSVARVSSDRVAYREQQRSEKKQSKAKKSKDDENDHKDNGDSASKSRSENSTSKKSSENRRGESSRKVSIVSKALSTVPFLGKRWFGRRPFEFDATEEDEDLLLADVEEESPMKRIMSYGLWGNVARKQQEIREKEVEKKKTFAVMGVLSTSTIYEFFTNLHITAAHPIIHHILNAK